MPLERRSEAPRLSALISVVRCRSVAYRSRSSLPRRQPRHRGRGSITATPRQADRDAETDLNGCSANGYRVLRFWNTDVDQPTSMALIDAVYAADTDRSPPKRADGYTAGARRLHRAAHPTPTASDRRLPLQTAVDREERLMPDLLLELFSEEIPARMQRKAAEDLKKLVTDALVEAGLRL